MSVFALIESNIQKTVNKYPEQLNFKNEDSQAGCGFMFYALEMLYKNLDFDQIEDGIVDSFYRDEQHDYGIDAIYITANGEPVTSVQDLKELNEDTKFIFHLLQFKKGRGIELSDLMKLKEGIDQIFINEKVDSNLNAYLYDLTKSMHEIKMYLYNKYSSSQISVKVYLVFGGAKSNIDKNTLFKEQIEKTKNLLEENAYTNYSYDIIDAQRLIDLSKEGDELIDIVEYEKTFKYIKEADENKKLNGYISIVSGREIARLVKQWQSALFEANIRDYYKKNEINNKILETCSSESDAKYFWSFNNGLTITCRKVEELPNDRYRLHGIQIVNGCQTSNAIYIALNNLIKYEQIQEKENRGDELSSKEKIEKEKLKGKILNQNTSILIKIIETNDADLIYRITETTNSQTPIKKFSLKANENIQQNIEKFLLNHDIYYERRINYYKNQGKSNIVSIKKLFQLYYSQIHFKPSQAKSRPKQLFDTYYDKVFPNQQQKIDFNIYLISILIDNAINKKIREITRTKDITDKFTIALLSYGKLHMGPLLIHAVIGSYKQPLLVRKVQIIRAALKNENELDKYFHIALENLKKIVQNSGAKNKEILPQLLKRSEIDEKIVRFIKQVGPRR